MPGTADLDPHSARLEPRRATLPGGDLSYLLRRSGRSRSLRVTIDPRLGVVVAVPPATRRGWAHPERAIEAFLTEREGWVRRHLARLARQEHELAARGGIRDGATFRYLGELHVLRLVAGPPGSRRSTVGRHGAEAGDELHVVLAPADRRPAVEVLDAWLRERARVALTRSVAQHASAMGVDPGRLSVRDGRTRWGSASRKGTLSFSWRLILAPPAALESVVVHELAHLRVFGHGPRFWEVVAARQPDHQAWRRWLRTHSHELHGALADPADRDGAAGA